MAEGGITLDVSCSVCFEEYDTPKVLNCGHTFCCQCLSKMLDKHLMYLVCPKCRKQVVLPESGNVADLPTNFDLMAITQQRPFEDPVSTKVIKEEIFTHPEAKTQCALHKKPLEFYCKSCQIQVCTQCLQGDHKPREHEIDTATDYAANLLEELQKFEVNLEEVKNKEKSLGCKIADSEVSSDQQYIKIEAEINEKVAQEQEKIRAKGNALLKELADKKAAHLQLFTDLKKQHSSLTSLSHQTDEKCVFLRQEFSDFNFSRQGELPKVSKNIEALNTNIQSLEKAWNTANSTEVEFHFHDTNKWDLGKLVQTEPTVDAEKANEAAGGIATAVAPVRCALPSFYLGDTDNESDYHYQSYSDGSSNESDWDYEEYSDRCFKCGEHNHLSYECRYDQPLKCRSCGKRGHKEKFCPRNSPEFFFL